MTIKDAARKKVVVFSPSLSAVSGVSTHVNMLLSSGLARDFEFIHFQVGSEGRAENSLRKFLRFVFSPFQLGLLLLKRKPDLIHINTSLDQKAFWRDVAYLAVARLLGVKVVNQIHGGSLPQAFFTTAALTWLLKQALLASDAVVVLTTEELEAYKAFDPRIRVSLVPNAIDDTSLIETERTQNLDGTLRIAYVGRLVKTKGLFEALDALKLLKDLDVDFGFYIAGGGIDEVKLRRRVEELSLVDRVKFLGPVFGKAKTHLWMESDVFLFPTYSEGLPYALLEAMAAGCVPVVCPVGGIPDVMQDGVHGIFVPLRSPEAIADALLRLWKDDGLLRAMASNDRSRINENYTVSRLVSDFERIYKDL